MSVLPGKPQSWTSAPRVGGSAAWRSAWIGPAIVVLVWSARPVPAAAPAAPPPPAASDEQRVADFLNRLGLVDVEALHLERVLQQPLPPDQQQRLGRRLADLYAGQLMDETLDDSRSAAVLTRISALINQVPQADTPALRVMLLQADYNRAESLAARWIGDSNDAEARSQSSEILERIAPQLDAYQRDLNAAVDQRTDELANLPEGDARAAAEQEYARSQAVAGRATYFAAWSHYYLGLMQDSAGQTKIQLARDTFRKLLDIRGEDYAALEAEWLGLESVWRCRAVIGLGLSEAALGDLAASRRCFDLLTDASVPPEMSDQAAFWYLQGLLNAGHYEQAADYAAQRVSEFGGQASPGKVSLCISLVRAAFGDHSAAPDGPRRQLGILGLEGLARLGQQTTIEALFKQYEIELGDQGGFFLTWLAGRRLLAAAQQSKRPEDYRAAAERLEGALSAADASRQLGSAAQCRYELAWCLFQLGEYERAGRSYQQASTGLKSSDAPSAAQAAWMAFASYQRLAEQQPRFATLAVDTLRTLKRDFPDHAYAQRADYYIDKLLRSAEDPETTLRRLEQVPPGDPSYLAAAYDACLVAHQLWTQGDQTARKDWSPRVLTAADKYLAVAQQEADPTRKLKCCLLAAEVALAGPAPQPPLARVHLDRAAALVPRLPENSSLLPEYRYRRLQLAAALDEGDDPLQHARWLVENASGTAYELPALIVMARAADERLRTAASDPQQQTAAWQAAYDVYQRLVQRLGTSAETLETSQNARVGLSRLAECAAELGHHDQAAQLLDRLLAAFPRDRNYLRRAGLAHFENGQYERSLEAWRQLLTGLSGGSDAWYEAKYYQVLCLKQTDAATAGKVLKQFQLLHPELGSPPWRSRFQALLTEAGGGRR